MNPFVSFSGIAAPYYVPDVDTDKLIPHRYLRKPLSAGYRNFLFYDSRFTPEGEQKPDFILHHEPYDRAQVLVTGPNFGCGSAREAAVYALYDFGFRALIAPGFADTFKANCLQTGMLPVELPDGVVRSLCAFVTDYPGATVGVDLEAQLVSTPDGKQHAFTIDPSRKTQLLEGLDDIGLTLKHRESIDAFEACYKASVPWLNQTTVRRVP